MPIGHVNCIRVARFVKLKCSIVSQHWSLLRELGNLIVVYLMGAGLTNSRVNKMLLCAKRKEFQTRVFVASSFEKREKRSSYKKNNIKSKCFWNGLPPRRSIMLDVNKFFNWNGNLHLSCECLEKKISGVKPMFARAKNLDIHREWHFKCFPSSGAIWISNCPFDYISWKLQNKFENTGGEISKKKSRCPG